MPDHAELAALFGHEPQTLDDIARAYLAALEWRRQAEKTLDQAKQAEERAQAALLLRLSENGLPSVEVDGTLLSAAQSRHYSVAPAVVEDTRFVAWLLRSGGHALLRRSVEARAFSHFCRGRVEKGLPLWAGVREYVRKVIQVRRAGDGGA